MSNKIMSLKLTMVGFLYLSLVGCGNDSQGYVFVHEPSSDPVVRSVVYHVLYQDLEQIEAEPIPGDPLPSSLIISPGNYVFDGLVYPAWDEGIYRFISPDEENQQRIVYDGGVENLLSALSWVHHHGHSDDGKSIEGYKEKIKTGKLSVACGDIAKLAIDILERYGVPTRLVAMLTLEEWDGRNDGHTSLEVYLDAYGKWVFFDLDNNAYYTQALVPLSLIELAEVVDQGDYEIEFLACDLRTHARGLGTDSFDHLFLDYLFLAEKYLASEETLKAWLKRIVQVPMIYDNPYFCFFDAEHRERIESYSAGYWYMEESEFMAKFYP